MFRININFYDHNHHFILSVTNSDTTSINLLVGQKITLRRLVGHPYSPGIYDGVISEISHAIEQDDQVTVYIMEVYLIPTEEGDE